MDSFWIFQVLGAPRVTAGGKGRRRRGRFGAFGGGYGAGGADGGMDDEWFDGGTDVTSLQQLQLKWNI